MKTLVLNIRVGRHADIRRLVTWKPFKFGVGSLDAKPGVTPRIKRRHLSASKRTALRSSVSPARQRSAPLHSGGKPSISDRKSDENKRMAAPVPSLLTLCYSGYNRNNDRNPERGQMGARLAERDGGVNPGGPSVINALSLSGLRPPLVCVHQVTCSHFSLCLAAVCQEKGCICSRAFQGRNHR